MEVEIGERVIDPLNQLFITLMKLKLTKDLTYRFGMSVLVVSKILYNNMGVFFVLLCS